MKYEKPELVVISPAVSSICRQDIKKGEILDSVCSNPTPGRTAAAYEVDE